VLGPVGGVLVAHFRLGGATVHVPDLYDPSGPYRGVLVPGVAAWALGALAYYLASPWGGTLPSLATAIAAYLLLRR
jgi:cytosine/uracil/thiamine/allantoin permease